jgi:hypothetical protein
MKLSKMFLAGIPALALVFGLTLVGCDDGSTTDPAPTAPAAGSNSLTGSWVDGTRTTPTAAFIFTDVPDAVITGAKVAYWSTNLTFENTPASNTQVTINNNGYTYQFSNNNNTLTLTGYATAVQGGTRADVSFDRAQGTSGTGIAGIWISRLADTNQDYTLLIVRQTSGNIFTSRYQQNQPIWGVTAYTLSSDANATYIKWGNGNPIAYTKDSDPTTLNITAPNNQQQTGLITQPAW